MKTPCVNMTLKLVENISNDEIVLSESIDIYKITSFRRRIKKESENQSEYWEGKIL